MFRHGRPKDILSRGQKNKRGPQKVKGLSGCFYIEDVVLSMSAAWFIYEMVAQSMLRMYDVKKVFSEKKSDLTTLSM